MKKLLNIALVGILAITTALTFTQMSVSAYAMDNGAPCEGLNCSKAGDCGSKCFCNNPYNGVGRCYLDSSEEPLNN